MKDKRWLMWLVQILFLLVTIAIFIHSSNLQPQNPLQYAFAGMAQAGALLFWVSLALQIGEALWRRRVSSRASLPMRDEDHPPNGSV